MKHSRFKKYLITHRANLLMSIILCFLSIPAITGLFTDPSVEKAKLENRRVASFPEKELFLSDTKLYFSKLEKYIDDHVGLSLFFYKINKEITTYLFRDRSADNITYGKDGFVFLNSHNKLNINSVFKQLCLRQGDAYNFEEIQDQWSKTMHKLNSRGYTTILSVVPSKPILYPEKLPETIPKELRLGCLEYKNKKHLLNKLYTNSINNDWLLYHPLEQFLKSKAQENFYPKENFHWKGESAHHFTTGLLQKLNIEINHNFSAKKQLATSRSDLSHLTHKKDKISFYEYDYSSFGIKTEDRQPDLVTEYYENANDFRESHSRRPLSQKKLLIISNSFGAELVKHISPAYQHVIHVNINHLQKEETYEFFTNFIDQLSPHHIIFMMQDFAVPNFGYRMYQNYTKLEHPLGDHQPTYMSKYLLYFFIIISLVFFYTRYRLSLRKQ